MKALANDIRKLLADRIQTSSAADLFAIATSICANDEAPPLAHGKPAKAWTIDIDTPRFTLHDLRGNVVQSGGVAVYDAEQNVTFTKAPLECGAVNWKDANKACAEFRLFGKSDWYLQTVKERASIVDFSKFGPALYSEFDAGGASCEWTSTPDAESPSDCAWLVSLHSGYVYRGYQTNRYGVRAVRAGQPLDLGL